MPGKKTTTMWQQLRKTGGARRSKQQEFIALHIMARDTSGNTEKITAKTIVKTAETQGIQASNLYKQKIALHKSLKKNQ